MRVRDDLGGGDELSFVVAAAVAGIGITVAGTICRWKS